MGQLLWQNNKGLFSSWCGAVGRAKGEPQPVRGYCPQSASDKYSLDVDRNTVQLFKNTGKGEPQPVRGNCPQSAADKYSLNVDRNTV